MGLTNIRQTWKSLKVATKVTMFIITFHEDLNVCVLIHITFKQSIKKANKLISNRFSVRMNRELLSSPHAITVLRGVGPWNQLALAHDQPFKKFKQKPY